MNVSGVFSNVENTINFIQNCSVSVRTKDGEIPLITLPSSKVNNSRAVQVYSGDFGKGILAASVGFILFRPHDLLAIIGLNAIVFAASTFQVSYHPPKTAEIVKQSVRKMFLW